MRVNREIARAATRPPVTMPGPPRLCADFLEVSAGDRAPLVITVRWPDDRQVGDLVNAADLGDATQTPSAIVDETRTRLRGFVTRVAPDRLSGFDTLDWTPVHTIIVARRAD